MPNILLPQQICGQALTWPYLSYSIHFIDKDWVLQAKCLQKLFVPRDHTVENLGDVMSETLTQWRLEASRPICITTDNGSTITCAATATLSWMQLPCFGHYFHLAVLNSTKDDPRVQHAIRLCRKLTSTFSHSWNKN